MLRQGLNVSPELGSDFLILLLQSPECRPTGVRHHSQLIVESLCEYHQRFQTLQLRAHAAFLTHPEWRRDLYQTLVVHSLMEDYYVNGLPIPKSNFKSAKMSTF